MTLQSSLIKFTQLYLSFWMFQVHWRKLSWADKSCLKKELFKFKNYIRGWQILCLIIFFIITYKSRKIFLFGLQFLNVSLFSFLAFCIFLLSQKLHQNTENHIALLWEISEWGPRKIWHHIRIDFFRKIQPSLDIRY